MKKTAVRRVSECAALLASAICVGMAPLVPAHAAPYEPTSTVLFIRSHDTSFGANVDWFAMQGVTSAGNCAKDNGLVVFRFKDDLRGQRHFAMLLAARQTGTPVTVSVDDTNHDGNGYCYVRWIG